MPSGQCEIHFYGERGLVNALFLDLKGCGATLEFLRRIEFSFRNQPRIELPDDTNVVVIVEAGFAQFGSPDAIVIANTSDGVRLVFFLEAKVGLYRNEAGDFTERVAGFNSTINGQFTLRYRLACALRECRTEQARLVEPSDLTTAYGEQIPRRLAKPENLEHIVRRHLLGASAHLFVALTDDSSNVWRDLGADMPKLLPYIPKRVEGHLSGYGAAWSIDGNAWADHCSDFGWIGFRDVEELLCGGSYLPHALQFLNAKRRIIQQIQAREFREFRNTVKWKLFDSGTPTYRVRERLRSMIEATPAVRDGCLKYKPGDGSDSVIDVFGQVVLKVITPQRAYPEFDVLFGVSIDSPGLSQGFRSKTLDTVGINRRGFQIVGVSELAWDEAAVTDLVLDTVSNVSEPPDVS
jgi:hypothetical protein